MIDLNRKPRKKQDDMEDDDLLKFISAIALIAFSLLLWWMLTQSFINGIY